MACENPKTVMDVPGWPTVFELNPGQVYQLTRTFAGKTLTRAIRLVSVTESWDPDYFTGNAQQRTLRLAEVDVDVSGIPVKLLCQPYQMPVVVNGLRLYVDMTFTWAHNVEYAPLPEMPSAIRLAVVLQEEDWGPSPFVFPIGQYLWRSSSYNNTWLSLVPYGSLYYHRGEDFGAIPDHLPVLAGLEGVVVASPLPKGDGASNHLILKTANGIELRYSHMNVKTIDPSLVVGKTVRAGMELGTTGMTCGGTLSQHFDPHLHFNIQYAGALLSAYPLVVESYFRSYPDEAIAVAGGWYYSTPGTEVHLDGSRSVARPNGRIMEYEWRLHDGRIVHAPRVKRAYEQPGLYSEELIVRTKNGSEARDFAQVRVYDPKQGRQIAQGWAHYTPVRGIRPGMPVRFWNRFYNMADAVQVDFGDGSPRETVKDCVEHKYGAPGVYVVVFCTRGSGNEPLTVKTRVAVGEAK